MSEKFRMSARVPLAKKEMLKLDLEEGRFVKTVYF
jgi:hypothetical protein